MTFDSLPFKPQGQKAGKRAENVKAILSRKI